MVIYFSLNQQQLIVSVWDVLLLEWGHISPVRRWTSGQIVFGFADKMVSKPQPEVVLVKTPSVFTLEFNAGR